MPSQKNKKKEEECDKLGYAKDKIMELTDEVISQAKGLKHKYDKSDPETKKKIIAGLASVAAGIAAIISLKKHGKKK